jgi:hypothetical protein
MIIFLAIGLIFVGLVLFTLMRTLDQSWSGKIKDLFKF